MNKKPARQKLYDCRRCQDSGDFEKLNCFWYGGEVQQVEFHSTIKDKSENVICTKGTVREFTAEELLEDFLPELTEAFPSLSLFQALGEGCRSVCPKSLVTPEVDEMLQMESFCRDYHVPPYGASTGYFDYPVGVIQSFGVISIARERVQMRELEELRNSGSGNQGNKGK
jgi:hypothetical protein